MESTDWDVQVSEQDLQPSNDLVATQLTPRGKAAVATIRLSGPSSRDVVDQFFQPRSPAFWAQQGLNRLYYGDWVGPEGDREDLVICKTGQAEYEIYCHGGILPVDRILGHVRSSGCRVATPWESLLTESQDAVVAEARWLLSHAGCRAPAEILSRQAMGALSEAIHVLRGLCQDGRIPDALEAANGLMQSWRWGQWCSRPFRVILCGRPNVGKSSLINAMLGYERSIVVDQPGTTRDLVTSRSALNGWPIEFIDTAGQRLLTDDPIEQEGINMAKRVLATADCVVAVSAFPDCEEAEVPDSFKVPIIQICNKADLLESESRTPPAELERLKSAILTSVVDQSGITSLLQRLQDVQFFDANPPAAVLFTQRQVTHLEESISDLQQGYVQEASHRLDLLLNDVPLPAPASSN